LAVQGAFMRGAVVLIIAGFINKVIGFLYRIFAVRVVGPEGIGLYEMVIPVYSLILVVTTAGIPLAISKYVSEQVSLGNFREARKIFWVALGFLLCSGLVSVGVLWAFIPTLVGEILPDPRVYWCILTLSPTLFFTSISSAFRGYYQGLQNMVPPAIGQVVEQVIRVTVGIYFASKLLPYGIEYSVAGLAAGTMLGELLGLLVLALTFASHRKKQWKLFPLNYRQKISSTGNILMSLFAFAIPVSLSRLINSLLLALQAIVIPLRLQVAGNTLRQATELYGQFSGIAISLLGLPTIITLSLATTLVPATSEALSKNDYQLLRSRTVKALQLSLIVGLPAGVVFYLLPEQLCSIIFNSPEAGIPLRILAIGCIFLYLSQTSSGILQGLGKVGITLRNSAAGAVCNIALIYVLTAVPTYGIRGTAIAMDISWALVALLNLCSVFYFTGISFSFGNFVAVPLVGSFLMGGVVYSLFQLIWAWTGDVIITTIGSLFAGGTAYFVYLLFSGTIKKDDLSKIPGIGPFLNSIY
jgi:stage V sporulation protein B